MYLLDTDTLIYWLNGNQNIERKAQSIEMDSLYYSVISKAELYFGAYNSSYVQQNLSNIQTLSQKLSMRPFDDKAANHFGQIKSDLKKRGEILSDADIMIVSIAFANNFTLVTNNLKHFARIRGLVVENRT